MSDSIFSRLDDPAAWEAYYAHKAEGGHLTKAEEADLRAFIDGRGYEPVVARLGAGEGFSHPTKKLLAKRATAKKRTVYLFPRDENYVLKLLSFLLERRYDDEFPPNLYSFRLRRGVVRAFSDVLRTPALGTKFTYKADISDYFNSIDVERMVAQLRELLAGEDETFSLMSGLLEDPWVWDGEELVRERKGVMAGQPTAVFCANLYLADLDRAFAADPSVAYARYSDDILVLADTAEERDASAARIAAHLAGVGLRMNPDKEVRTAPGEMWTFLGLSYQAGTVDISPVSAAKLKAKIRRKARAIDRWRARKGATCENAVTAFIRAMNRKFFSADDSHELTWSRWYFPLITTDVTLRDIDAHMQRWIRFLATGTHAKASFRYRYEDMKARGYVSLVAEWYKGREADGGESAAPQE